DPFGIELALVATTHLGEHLVTSALHWHVEVWDKSFGLFYQFTKLVRNQVGFDSRNLETVNTINIIQGAHKIQKFILTLAITNSKIPNVHTRQNDFFYA